MLIVEDLRVVSDDQSFPLLENSSHNGDETELDSVPVGPAVLGKLAQDIGQCFEGKGQDLALHAGTDIRVVLDPVVSAHDGGKLL